jgi:hypothetical protein
MFRPSLGYRGKMHFGSTTVEGTAQDATAADSPDHRRRLRDNPQAQIVAVTADKAAIVRTVSTSKLEIASRAT